MALFQEISQESTFHNRVSVLHSQMDLQAQIATLRAFAEQRDSRILIATNIVQGVNLSHVTHIINYDMPYNRSVGKEPSYNKMLRRIGRSEEEPQIVVIHFVKSPSDQKALQLFELYFNVDVKPLDIHPKTPVNEL